MFVNDTVETYKEKLEKLILNYGKKVIAIGECGLDYDRFDYVDKET